MKLTRWPALVAALFTVGFAAQNPARGGPLSCVQSDHFIVGCPTEDISAGRITEAHLRETLDIAETAYRRYVDADQLGLSPPAGELAIDPRDGRARTVLLIYDWDAHGRHRAEPAFATIRGYCHNGVIHLRLEEWGTDSAKTRSPKNWARQRLRVLAHELFHAIQLNYDPGYSDLRYNWFLEATAEWAVHAAFPELEVVNLVDDASNVVDMGLTHVVFFLAHAQAPIHFDTKVELLDVGNTGHPYGTAILFRFLAAQHPKGRELIKPMMEAFRKAPADVDPLRLIAEGMGMAGKDYPQFLALYDRFAAAAALGPHAADADALPDAARLGDIVRLTKTGFTASYLGAATTAEQAIYTIPRLSEAGPGGAPLDRRAAITDEGRFAGSFIGTGGFRCFPVFSGGKALRPWPQLPRGAVLQVDVPAEERAISVQGISYLEGRATTVRKATYDSAGGRYVLRVPNFDRFVADTATAPRGEFLVVVTRFSGGPDFKDFPIHVTLAEPPVLRSVKVLQAGQAKYHVAWDEQRDPDGVVASRTRQVPVNQPLQGTGSAELELVFSTAVTPPTGGQPLASIDDFNLELTPSADGVTWRGAIPPERLAGPEHTLRVRAETTPAGAKFKLPLDNDPTTVAEPVLGKWARYERGGDGTVVTIGTAAEPPVAVKIALRTYPKSSETFVLIQSPAFADMRAGKLKCYFDGDLRVSPSADGPFERKANRLTIAAYKKPLAAADQPGEGWVASDTYQAPLYLHTAMQTPDPTDPTRTRHDGAGPVYIQAILTQTPTNPGPSDARPTFRSNVAAPTEMEIGLDNAVKNGGEIVLHETPYASGSLRLFLAPKDQVYRAAGVRFRVTFDGQVRYAFSPSDPSKAWLGSAAAVVPVPSWARAITKVEVVAEHAGRTYTRNVPVWNDPAAWDKVLKERDAWVKKVDQETEEYTRVTQKEYDLSKKWAEQSRESLRRLEAAGGADATALAKARKAADEGAWKFKREEINLKEPDLDRDLRIGEALRNYARLAKGRRGFLEVYELRNQIDPQRDEPKAKASFASSQASRNSDIAEAALNGGDLATFRDAMGRLIELRRSALATGVNLPKDDKAGHVAAALQGLADGLVLLTGERAEAKRLWLEAHELRKQHATGDVLKYVDDQWKRGIRPDWWPGD